MTTHDHPATLTFDGGRTAAAIRVERPADLAGALTALGVPTPRRTLALVGGAGGLDPADVDRLRPVFASALVPLATRFDAVTVDGGTASGVMALLGEAHAGAGATVPLIGVAAAGTVRLPGGRPPHEDAARLDEHHTHFVLVPGDEWGDEGPWLSHVADAASGGMPSATVVVNGGEIVYSDTRWSVEAGRPVVTVAGSGRTADALAAAVRGDDTDERAAALASSGTIRVADVDDPAELVRALTMLLE